MTYSFQFLYIRILKISVFGLTPFIQGDFFLLVLVFFRKHENIHILQFFRNIHRFRAIQEKLVC